MTLYIFYEVVWFIFLFSFNWDSKISEFYLFTNFFILNIGINLYIFWYLKNFLKKFIKNFNFYNQDQKKNSQINDFINRLLPKHVQDILNNPNCKLSENYKDVTIIFADICGFTAYSADKQPKEVVHMLSKLFTDFDKVCDSLQLFKVYTIGDCYVALGFLDSKSRKEPHIEAKNIIDFAFKMIDIIVKVRKEIDFEDLAMRIGIHTVN